ncbi:hypothetical protein SUGI_1003960 [Cryptomeria japonica]|nr:hypothetical protein SUGI_1003960 [Cryptomeria japonica]
MVQNIIVIFKIYILLCFVCSQTHGCHKIEKDALLKFRDNLKDPNALLNSWKGSSNFYQWTTLHCDSPSGRVDSLDFRGLNLSTHSTEKLGLSTLFPLSQLKCLDLSMNSFHGLEMPPNMSLLT